MVDWMFVLGTRKAVMPKMKCVAARNLEDSTKFTTQIIDTTNKKNGVSATKTLT